MPKKEKSFLDNIIDTFGESVLEGHKKEIKSISTGSLSLDTSIGVGGIPKGMITVIYGPEGSGKTTLALSTSKVVANSGGRVLYIEVENLLNNSIIKAVLGEDTNVDNIIILSPESGEDAFMMAEAGIQSGEFDLVVVDSIGAMVSKKELEVPFDKDTVGQLPRMVGKFIKRNIYSIRTSGVAVLILNQVRDNVGSYMKSFSMPGGHQLQHEAAVVVSLTKGEKLSKGKDIVGIVTKFVVKKNKLAPPFRSFTIPIVFGQGIDYFSDLLEFSKLLGVVTSNGPYYKFEDVNLGKGKNEASATLLNDKELLDKLVQTVYNTVNKDTGIADVLNDLDGEVVGDLPE